MGKISKLFCCIEISKKPKKKKTLVNVCTHFIEVKTIIKSSANHTTTNSHPEIESKRLSSSVILVRLHINVADFGRDMLANFES